MSMNNFSQFSTTMCTYVNRLEVFYIQKINKVLPSLYIHAYVRDESIELLNHPHKS